jgi:hypothetical protein
MALNGRWAGIAAVLLDPNQSGLPDWSIFKANPSRFVLQPSLFILTAFILSKALLSFTQKDWGARRSFVN